MQRNFQIIIFLVITIFISKLGLSQDASFSQFYANPLYLNPALTGSTECGRFNLNYRNQWPSLNNAFITYNASYDQNIPFLSSGIGVSVIGDNSGNNALSTNIVSGFYSFKLQINKSLLLSAGFQGSYYQKKLDWNNLIFGDQIDPGSGNISPTTNEPMPGSLNKSFVDFSTGFMIGYLDKFFGGVGVHHLTQPNNGFYDNSSSTLSMKISVHGGTIINLSNGNIGGANSGEIILRPNIIYQQQGKFHQMNLGAYLSKYPFVGGLWFRHNFENADAAIILLGFQHNRYRIGYSYDFSLSKLSGNSGGAHEISFSWEFCIYKGEKRRLIKAIKAPTF